MNSLVENTTNAKTSPSTAAVVDQRERQLKIMRDEIADLRGSLFRDYGPLKSIVAWRQASEELLNRQTEALEQLEPLLSELYTLSERNTRLVEQRAQNEKKLELAKQELLQTKQNIFNTIRDKASPQHRENLKDLLLAQQNIDFLNREKEGLEAQSVNFEKEIVTNFKSIRDTWMEAGNHPAYATLYPHDREILLYINKALAEKSPEEGFYSWILSRRKDSIKTHLSVDNTARIGALKDKLGDAELQTALAARFVDTSELKLKRIEARLDKHTDLDEQKLVDFLMYSYGDIDEIKNKSTEFSNSLKNEAVLREDLIATVEATATATRDIDVNSDAKKKRAAEDFYESLGVALLWGLEPRHTLSPEERQTNPHLKFYDLSPQDRWTTLAEIENLKQGFEEHNNHIPNDSFSKERWENAQKAVEFREKEIRAGKFLPADLNSIDLTGVMHPEPSRTDMKSVFSNSAAGKPSYAAPERTAPFAPATPASAAPHVSAALISASKEITLAPHGKTTTATKALAVIPNQPDKTRVSNPPVAQTAPSNPTSTASTVTNNTNPKAQTTPVQQRLMPPAQKPQSFWQKHGGKVVAAAAVVAVAAYAAHKWHEGLPGSLSGAGLSPENMEKFKGLAGLGGAAASDLNSAYMQAAAADPQGYINQANAVLGTRYETFA
ncbi:MAG: hypothetical protein INF44_07715, partial [Thalassospira sp.]|nr:hypothetical protein [Thalassospira sp.]